MTPRAAVLLAVVSLALAGCELPRPFAHEGPMVDNALLDLPTGDGVRVVVLDGLDPDIATPLRDAAIKALGEAGIPASGEATLARGYVLTGAVQIDDPDNGQPEAARFVWQLTGRDGLALGAFDKEVSGLRSDWPTRQAGVLEDVARDASVRVASLLRTHDPQRRGTVDGVTEAAVPAVEPKLFLEGVVGAPGDGDESLMRAMTSVLKRSGVPLADSAEQATHLLACTVTAEPGADGVSEVSLDWYLSARDGSEVGTISQKNPVKTALIEGYWGELAHIVAGAAAEGILDAFATVGAPVEAGLRPVPAQ